MGDRCDLSVGCSWARLPSGAVSQRLHPDGAGKSAGLELQSTVAALQRLGRPGPRRRVDRFRRRRRGGQPLSGQSGGISRTSRVRARRGSAFGPAAVDTPVEVGRIEHGHDILACARWWPGGPLGRTHALRRSQPGSTADGGRSDLRSAVAAHQGSFSAAGAHSCRTNILRTAGHEGTSTTSACGCHMQNRPAWF